MNQKRFAIVTHSLSSDAVAQLVAAPGIGAIVTFVGTVRDNSAGHQVDYLEYEAYAEMAEPLLEQIGQEAQERWPSIQAVAIVHRVGKLQVGEASIVIAVAAAHRTDTFAACSYIIDRVKAIIPIWKKEVGANGATWVESPHRPEETSH